MNGEPDELRVFQPGGLTYEGLQKAQQFFDDHVRNVESVDRAMLWMTEELGEAAQKIRQNEDEQDDDRRRRRSVDAVGDLAMWVITLSRLLGVSVADAVAYSTRQLVGKGYSNLPADGIEIGPPP